MRLLAVLIVVLVGHTPFNLIIYDFLCDKPEKVDQFFALILELLEFVEEAGQRFRPIDIELCHPCLHFKQQSIHFLQILVSEALEEL